MPPPDLLRGLARGLLDLVFAPVCLGCGAAIATAAEERRVCGVCWSRVRPVPLPRCERCWHPLPLGPPGQPPLACALCPVLPPACRAVRSGFVHDGPIRQMLHALKYEGWWSVADPLAARLAPLPWPREVTEEVRLVVPVPLGPARLRQRGYNQAALLAGALAPRRGWECRAEVAERVRETRGQTTLPPEERRANVAGAFRVRPGAEAAIDGEHLLLVDDVWTTGATALACGEALIRAGARAYSVLTVARALPELHR